MSWDSIGTAALGSTVAVPRFGFGGAWITGPGTYGPSPDPDGARRAVRMAVERGVRLVDTADCYGPEISEQLVGEALRPHGDGVVVATKGGRIALGANRFRADGRPEHLRRACDASLRRLRLETIGLYQLNAVDPNVALEESLGCLVDLKAEGKVGEIGLCNVGVAELERARAVTAIASVQDRYDLLTRGTDDVRKFCAEHGIAFLPWCPPLNDLRLDATSPLAKIAAARAVTPSQVALAWLLHGDRTTLPIPGSWRPDWEDDNLGAVDLDLDARELAELDAVIAKPTP